MNTERDGQLINKGLPSPINYEDFYTTRDDLMYEQIRNDGKFNSVIKIIIRRNSYDYQSYGNLFVMRSQGWVLYHTIRIERLRAFKWSHYKKGVVDIEEALEDFRADSQEMCDLFSFKNQGDKND
jgi:hypothetical protein